MPAFFAVLDAAIKGAHEALASAEGPVSVIGAAKLAVAMRGLTLLQAGRLLLMEGHWETASGVARQLFELLVDIEYLVSHDDVNSAWMTYMRFGMVQEVRSRRRAIDYAAAVGREIDDESVRILNDFLQMDAFDDLRDRKGDFVDRWSRHNVKYLAEKSRSPVRKAQYEYYYATWSEQTHATPSALVESMLPQEALGVVERTLDRVYRETRQLIVMLISLFSELLIVLSDPPMVPVTTLESWREQLKEAEARFSAANSHPHRKQHST